MEICWYSHWVLPGPTWSYLDEDRRGQAEFDVSNSEWPHCDAEPAYSKIQRNGSQENRAQC